MAPLTVIRGAGQQSKKRPLGHDSRSLALEEGEEDLLVKELDFARPCLSKFTGKAVAM